jgi:hypothetical protein
MATVVSERYCALYMVLKSVMKLCDAMQDILPQMTPEMRELFHTLTTKVDLIATAIQRQNPDCVVGLYEPDMAVINAHRAFVCEKYDHVVKLARRFAKKLQQRMKGDALHHAGCIALAELVSALADD